MADLLISPQPYTTHGGVPRRLLAGVFLVVVLTAMGVFLATAKDEPLQTGDQKARAELMKPEAMTALAKGQESSVDEAADRARLDVEQADKAKVLRADNDQLVDSLPLLPMAAPRTRVPAVPGNAVVPSTGPGEADAAAAERERAARSAASTVFDESSVSTGVRANELVATTVEGASEIGKSRSGGRGRDIDSASSLPEHVRRNLTAIETSSNEPGPQEHMAQVLSAMQASAGAASAPSDRASRQKAWASQVAEPAGNDVLHPKAAASDLLLYQGTVIPCVLTRRIKSDLPGPITARVSMNVYDSRTSRKLLLPKGALLVGAYSSDIQDGQERLQFAFTRLRMPDGSTYDLPGATGSDAAGQSGATGDVDRHFVRRFGSALLLGLLADRVTKVAALPRGGTAEPGGLSATGQVFVDTARAELERHKAVPPTITVEEGSRLNVEVVRDIDFPQIYGAPK